MGQSTTRVNVEFLILDGKVVPVSFGAYRGGMYPDSMGQYPELTDDGQLEDMVADFLKDFGVDLNEWSDDEDMGKQELITTVGELLLKAKKKDEEDEEDDDDEDEDEEDDDEDEEDEEDDDDEEDDEEEGGKDGKGKKTAKQLIASLDEILSKKHVGFAKLASKIAVKSGVGKERAAKIAAAIGRKKYGAEKMAVAAHKGKALSDKQAKK